MAHSHTAGRLRGLVTLVVLSGLAIGFHPAARAVEGAATPAPGPEFGVIFHAGWTDYSNQERLAVLDRLAAAGVKWVRVDVGWSSFEEDCPGCYEDWYIDILDFVVDAARARGISVLGMLWRTPGWANGGAGVYAPPTDPQDYGRAARWAAEHFRGRVAAWEVWNEPNLDYFWSGNAQDYAELLRAAYPQFKAGDPAARVVLGGPVHNDTDWLRAVYQAGAHGSFDVMATHPYQGPSDLPPEVPDPSGDNIWLLSHVAAVRELMASYGDGDREIWFTEFGWSAHENWAGVENWNRGVTPAQQGEYLVRTLEYVAQKHPYVTNVFWYNERNRQTGDVHLDNYGLLDRNLKPNPVYQMLKAYLAGGGPSPGAPPGHGATCTLTGTGHADVLRGTPRRDVICAGSGHDLIRAAAGKDRIYGGGGNDRMYGQAGRDVLKGGRGRDTFRPGKGMDRVRPGPGRDRITPDRPTRL